MSYSTVKKGGEPFKPHMMYNPETSEGIMVYSMEEHLELKDKGYLHQDELEKLMLGGLTDNKNKALESSRNELFRTNPSIATQNEENPGINNLNNFVNSVALNTQGSLMDGAIQQTQNQFFAGGITNPTDPPEDPPNTSFVSKADNDARLLAEGTAKNQELKSVYDSELSNYNTYLSEKEKYDAANSGYTGSLDAYNYQQANSDMFPTQFGNIGWRSGLDSSFKDTSRYRQLDEQELNQFNELRKSETDRNNQLNVNTEGYQKESFIPSTSTYVPVDSNDGYKSGHYGSIYNKLQKPTAPGVAPTEVAQPTVPSYVDTSQYINPEITPLPVMSQGTLSGTPIQGIIGEYEEDELEAPTYNTWEGSRPQKIMGVKNPLYGGRRLSGTLAQKFSGYDSDAMHAEVEAAENEGRRINFDGLGKGSASSGKFQKQYNEEYDAYEAALKQREDDENYAKAMSQSMFNMRTGQDSDNLVQAEQFGGSHYNFGGASYNPNFGYRGAKNFDAFNTANTDALNAGAQGVADLSGFGKSFSEGLVNSYINPNMTTKVKTKGKGFMDKLDVLGENIINAPRNMWGKATAGFNELKDFRSKQESDYMQPFYNNLTEAGVDINNKKAVNKFIGGKSVAEMNQLLGGMLNNQQRFGGPEIPLMDVGGGFHLHPHTNTNFFQNYADQNFVQPTTGTIIGSSPLGITPRYFPPPMDYTQQFRNGLGYAYNGLQFGSSPGSQQGQVKRVGTATPVTVDDDVKNVDESPVDPNMPGVVDDKTIEDNGVKVIVDEDGKKKITIDSKEKKRGNSENPNIVVDETETDEDGNLYLPEQVFRLNPRAFGNSTVDGVMTSPYGAVAYNPNETYLNKFKHKTNMFGGNKTVMKFDHAGVDLSADRRARRKARKDARNTPETDPEVNPEDYEIVEDNTSWQNNRPETFYHANPLENVEINRTAGPRIFNAEPYVVGDDMSTNSPNYVGSINPSYAQVDQYSNPTLQNPMQGTNMNVVPSEPVPFNYTQLQNNIMMDADRMYGGSSTNSENMNYDYFNRGGVPSRRDNREFAREQIQGRDKFSRQDRRRLRRDLNRGLETQEGYMQYQEPAYEQAPIVREDNSFNQNISPMPLVDPGMVTMPEAQPMNLEAANAGVTDDMSFGQAFGTANKALGENGTFMWRGKKYGTRRDPNWRGNQVEEERPAIPRDGQGGIGSQENEIANNGITDVESTPLEEAQSVPRKKLASKAKTREEMESAFIADAKARNHIPKNARIGRRQDGTAYVNIDGQNREIKSNDGKTWMLTPEGTNSPIYNKRYNYSSDEVSNFNYDPTEDNKKVETERINALPQNASADFNTMSEDKQSWNFKSDTGTLLDDMISEYSSNRNEGNSTLGYQSEQILQIMNRIDALANFGDKYEYDKTNPSNDLRSSNKDKYLKLLRIAQKYMPDGKVSSYKFPYEEAANELRYNSSDYDFDNSSERANNQGGGDSFLMDLPQSEVITRENADGSITYWPQGKKYPQYSQTIAPDGKVTFGLDPALPVGPANSVSKSRFYPGSQSDNTFDPGIGPNGAELVLKEKARRNNQRIGGPVYMNGGSNGNMYGQGISGYYGNGGANMYGYGGADMYGHGGMNYFPQAPARRVVRMQGGGSDMVSIHQGELAKLQEMAAMGQQAVQSNEMYNAMNNGINPMG